MIPVNEFRNIASEPNPRFRILKPWWDVFSEYLCIAMLMIGVFGCTLQLTQEKISCLPDRISETSDVDMDCNHLQQPRENKSFWEHVITKQIAPNIMEIFGRKNDLDIHQYIYINSFCYERAVHWYAKYFPYLVVIHTMIFMVASNFWFKFPGTSSKIELFVAILAKCFDSPWTTRAISEVSEEREGERAVMWKKNAVKPSAVESPDGESEATVFMRSTSVVSNSENDETEPATSVLDKKEGEQAKALFEKVSESRLGQVNLNHEWPIKKLRTRLTRNASNRLELHLFMLSGLPDTVFELPEVESLKLEMISNMTISGTVTQLTALQELSLIHCPAKLHLPGLAYLRENLKVLHLNFDSLEQVPMWMYTLQNLEELHISGPLSNELSRSSNLDTLRELKKLRVLTLRSKLTKIPSAVGDVAGELLRLCVHNEGIRLQAFSSLKKLVNLATLELTACELERLPSAVFSLASLQELDLRENRLTMVEEILSLQHCRRLNTLKLWHNSITSIPEHISKLRSLETLNLSWNKIWKLPPRLCYCTKLQHLDLSHNQLKFLPPEIGILQSLWHFSAAYNSLEALPDELFSCKRLRTLALGNNSIAFLSPRVGNLAHLICLELKGNRLESLPVEIADCSLLKLSGLLVEDSLLDLLPSEIKRRMNER
ncbi:volume-regulated anion channel subunit LRRC8E isoform X2 [Pygocentrus nattereri]|uniref:volume-regulated anion channel subunit LRRC8E isoform X2 n=1 Tax=Pygocentrus nattereri TaxID=42514 RepID=UPI001890E41D|nr:volume-regulated anion channel subunit LRRC8E isoform X2 [Pygocentrus nattereri]